MLKSLAPFIILYFIRDLLGIQSAAWLYLLSHTCAVLLPSKRSTAATLTLAIYGLTQIYQWMTYSWVIIIVQEKPVI